MKKIRRYEIEGITLEIPLRFDALSQIYIEEYPDFIRNPVYTKSGCPVLFIGEDACTLAEASDGGCCPDCGSCRFFRPADSHTWIGICTHEKHRFGCPASFQAKPGNAGPPDPHVPPSVCRKE